MGIIKKIREHSGYTQIELAKKAGLSLRTIQRLEASNNEPKGYTLKILSAVFEVTPSILQEKFLSVQQNKDSDILTIKTINLSVLAFLGIPFGNIILPLILWRKNRQSKLVDEVGRKIINFQIIWTTLLSLLLCLTPFINIFLFSSTPLILIVLFTALATNIIVVCIIAISLQRNNLNFLNLPIRFF